MKYLSLLLLLFISCTKRRTNECILNEILKNNKIQIMNLSQNQLSPEMVLDSFEIEFLEKYSFYPNYKVKSINVNEINCIREKSNSRYSKVSPPIFSNDNKYCLFRITEYSNQEILNDVIYLFIYSNNKWNTLYELERHLF